MAEDLTKNPLYIGATNFANLQKQYTANQIEQATTRDTSGNIFWKEGVNIADIPKTATAATIIPPTTTDIPKTSDILAGGTVNLKDLTSGTSATDLATARNAVAESALSGVSYQYDALLAQEQAAIEKKKAEQENLVQQEKSYLMPSLITKKREQALEADRKLFEVEQNVRVLGEIRSQIAAAKAALEQGMIYEQGRPVRQSLLQGRTAELQSQGVAKINALNATASVIQGNIDLAASYAKATQDAIEGDYQEQFNAITTLLELDNNELIRLTDREKEILDARNGILEQTILQKQKDIDNVFTLITSAPYAAADGKVSFSDSLETALGKMLPFMSDRDKLMFQAELDAKNRTNTGGSGGSGSVGSFIEGGTTGSSTFDSFLSTLTPKQQQAVAKAIDDIQTTAQNRVGKDTIVTTEDLIATAKSMRASIIAQVGEEGYNAILNSFTETDAEADYTATVIAEMEKVAKTTTEKLNWLIKHKQDVIDIIGEEGYRRILTSLPTDSESSKAKRDLLIANIKGSAQDFASSAGGRIAESAIAEMAVPGSSLFIDSVKGAVSSVASKASSFVKGLFGG